MMRYFIIPIVILISIVSTGLSQASYRETFEKEFMLSPWYIAKGEISACIQCHTSDDMGPEMHEITQQWKESFHAKHNVSCHDCHGGDPEAYEIATAHRGRFLGIPTKLETIELCSECHADPNQMRQFGLAADQLAEFRDLAELAEMDLSAAVYDGDTPAPIRAAVREAGQVVVTNTCMNKTVEELENISANFCVAEPTVTSIAAALDVAAKRVSDLTAREAGAQVNWSQDWNQTFSPELLNHVQQWFPEVKLKDT